MWVQLTSVKYVETHGKTAKYSPGDWVDVGKQTALLWLDQGDACIPGELPVAINGSGAGALILSGAEHAAHVLTPYTGLDIQTSDDPALRWGRTIIWDAGQCPSVTPSRFGAGLQLLETWDLAVPLCDYKTLAMHVGSEAERKQTEEVILDLRVPLYDTRLMFARKTPDVERLFDAWAREPGERRLAFLRALWAVKPFVLALPAHWTGGEYAG